MEVLEILSFGSFVLGLLAVSILLFVSRVNAFSRYMLAISFFSLSWLMLTNYLFLSKNIYFHPHLFRTASPLTYLIIPCGFLYVRSILYNEKSARNLDWLHFMPAFLHTIELLPYYIKSADDKQEELSTVLAHLNDVMYLDEGLLPTHTHMLLKVTLGFVYVVYQFYIIHEFIKTKNIKPGSTAWYTCNWLRLLTFAYGALAMLILLIATVHIPLLEENAYLLVAICLCVVYTLTIFFLFFKPHMLYGQVLHPQFTIVENEANGKKKAPKKTILNKQQLKTYRTQIEQYFSDTKPYLRPGFSAKDMEKETGIPRHHLSEAINTEYGMHFSDLVNRLRIDYVSNQLNLTELEHLTLEAIAEKAGFNSRTTFFHAVKKFTGQTPTAFIRALKQRNSGL